MLGNYNYYFNAQQGPEQIRKQARKDFFMVSNESFLFLDHAGRKRGYFFKSTYLFV